MYQSFFLQDYGEDIIMSTKLDIDKTVFIRIYNIKRYVLIAALPQITLQQSYNFIKQFLGNEYTIENEPVQMYEDNISLLTKKWNYFKVYSSKKNLINLISIKDAKKWSKYTIQYKYDNYIIPEIEATDSIKEVSKFYFNYYNKLISLQNLQGIDKLIQPYLRYPFRQTEQDYTGIQYKYKINFFNPFSIKDEQKIIQQNPSKYNCDEIWYVDIENIQQIQDSQIVEEKIQSQLELYQSIMFDIENYVFIPSSKRKETYNNLFQSKQFYSDLSSSYLLEYQKQPNNKYKFSDQEQITSISFVEQNFKSQILKKYAIMNIPEYDSVKYPKEQVLKQINEKYAQDQKYVDEIFIYDNEKELLQKTIQILTSSKYYIIQHFNGWKFDEPTICIRMLLYNLLDEYLIKMLPIKTLINQIKYIIPADGKYKQNASQTETNLTQLKSPLKFSLDVYQLNLHDDVGAQKHDGGNSLNSLLQYHQLGLKGDFSYQQISEAFEEKNVEDLIEAAWYCQRDSIQQCVLQKKLKIILNHVQFSRLCQINLKDSVQKAVGTKVVSTVYKYYDICNVAIQDILAPYQYPQTVTVTVKNEDRDAKVKNVGGEVECFIPGYGKCITAVDAASMYPAQVEANNTSDDCMILPEQMDYILQNIELFDIKRYKFETILDLYSPYTSENFPQNTEFIQNLVQNIQPINNINFEMKNQYTKQPRTRIILTDNNDKQIVYEQFYYEKQIMQYPYNFVYYIQGKSELNLPWSPRANLLTQFRFLRKGVKKQIKETKDEDLQQFFDGKQNAIKTCMNSLYGTADAIEYSLFENLGPSIITKCSRCEIRNCRDNIQHTIFYIQERHNFQQLKPQIQQYNNFVKLVMKQPEQFIIKTADQQKLLAIPKLFMKYQDTDSNYFIMKNLDDAEVNPDYKECEVKPHLLGTFNSIFTQYINNSMNKFPLEFAFEGAFYKAWHICKKMYLGQKVPQFVFDIKYSEDNQITKITKLPNIEIHENIQLDDFNPENDDIYVFIQKRHLKVTGLKIVKRDTTILVKLYYMKFIQQLLNNTDQRNKKDMNQNILNLLLELKNKFINNQIQTKEICLQKKITTADMQNSNSLKIYNIQNPEKKLGLGQMLYTYVRTLSEQDPLIFQQSSFKTKEQQKAISYEQLQEYPTDIYYGYYLLSVAKSLIQFTMIFEEEDMKVEKIAQQTLIGSGIIQTKYKTYKLQNLEQDIKIFKSIVQQQLQNQNIIKNYYVNIDNERQKIIIPTFVKNVQKNYNTNIEIQNLLSRYNQLINK